MKSCCSRLARFSVMPSSVAESIHRGTDFIDFEVHWISRGENDAAAAHKLGQLAFSTGAAASFALNSTFFFF